MSQRTDYAVQIWDVLPDCTPHEKEEWDWLDHQEFDDYNLAYNEVMSNCSEWYGRVRIIKRDIVEEMIIDVTFDNSVRGW